MKDSKQLLGESSAILVVTTILTKTISAIFKLPLASDAFLGEVGFGYFSVAHDLFMPFYLLAISGLPAALSKITAENLAKKNFLQVKNNFFTARRLFILLGIAFSLLLSLFSIPLVLSKGSVNSIYSVLAVMPSVFFCFLISVYRGYFEGFSNMYPSAISKIIDSLSKLCLGLIFSFVVIRLTNDPALAAGAAMLAVSFATLVSILYLHLKFKRNNPLDKLTFEKEESFTPLTIKALFVLAIPFVIASLASSVVSVIDVFTVNLKLSNADNEYLSVLNAMYNNGGALQNQIGFDMAAYLYGVKSKAFAIYHLIPTVTMSLGVAALPIISTAVIEKDNAALKDNTQYLIKILSSIAFPAAIGLFVLAGPIMKLLYSSNDPLSGNLLSIYAFTALFSAFVVPFTTLLQALNKHYSALIHIIIGVLIKIVVNVILVMMPTVNIYSAPIGTLACYAYISISFFVLLKLNVKNLAIFKTVLKPLFAALICGGVAFLISNFASNSVVTVIAIFAAIFVYITMLALFRTFTKTEIYNLLKIKRK